MNIDVFEGSGSLVLTVEGDLDIATTPLLAEQLARAEASDAMTIVVDLDQVDFMDSTGLHLLLEHVRASRQDGQRLLLTPGSEQVQRLFEITGALDQLPFFAGSKPSHPSDQETPPASRVGKPTIKRQPQVGSPRLNDWRADADSPGRHDRPAKHR